MFIIRRLTSQNVEMNTVVGDEYVLVNKSLNKADYEHLLDGQSLKEEGIYGFITYADGAKSYPLYEKSEYYIMLGNGQTFAKL